MKILFSKRIYNMDHWYRLITHNDRTRTADILPIIFLFFIKIKSEHDYIILMEKKFSSELIHVIKF